MLHLRGASLRLPGDVVLTDVARGGAHQVVDRLRDLGVHHEGAIHVEPVRAWISQPGYDAEQRTPGSSADSVVWPTSSRGRTRSPSSTGPTSATLALQQALWERLSAQRARLLTARRRDES